MQILCCLLLCLGVGAMWGCGSNSCTCSPPTDQRQACMTNLKQAGLGLQMYVQDYDEQFPTVSSGWMDVVLPYVKNDEIYHCPTILAQQSTAYGYAFNSALAGKSLVSLDVPSATQMLYDSTTLTRNAVAPLTSLPKPGRHDGMDNIVYADGHAASSSPP